ncbi:MAG: hypothetical protein IJ644_11010 [Oscillospiraceae bacterium]|nr:hypothetical protein [Oscillospiraceae bacterium]
MNELLNMLLNLLKQQQDYPFFEVYPTFDAVPVSSKSHKLFVVLSPECFQLHQAFPDGNSGIAPFTATFRISVLAPAVTPAEKLLEFFYSVLVPVLHSANCFLSETQADAPKTDGRLQKLVYSGTFRLKGVYVPDNDSQEATP